MITVVKIGGNVIDDPQALQDFLRQFEKVPGKKILVHPGSRSAFRIWPPARFAAVCDRLQEQSGGQVFLTAGPAERPVMEEIRRLARTHLVTINSVASIGAFAALAAQFDVFLCHDSGPMHVAAGVGTPVVALYSSQNATVWRPLGHRHIVLQTPLPCACLGADAPTPCVRTDSYRSYCVRMLSEEQVFQAVDAALRHPSRGQPVPAI